MQHYSLEDCSLHQAYSYEDCQPYSQDYIKTWDMLHLTKVACNLLIPLEMYIALCRRLRLVCGVSCSHTKC